MTPLFLDLEHTLRLHRSLIQHYGGIEGIRDVGLLRSAIAMPQAAHGGEYLHHDIFEMAAALGFATPAGILAEPAAEPRRLQTVKGS